MTQALEIVTNSPNLDHHCEMIPHGRLRASLQSYLYKQQFVGQPGETDQHIFSKLSSRIKQP